MSEVRTSSTYTFARRFPTVIGRLGDWHVPFGPFTPAQLIVLALGTLALVYTASWWWAVLGPVPPLALGFAVWALRGAKIAGQDPVMAGLGLVVGALRPVGGRVGGRAARDRRSSPVLGGFVVQDLVDGGEQKSSGPRARRDVQRVPGEGVQAALVPVTELERLVAGLGGRR
ncbi:hypothetical protein ABZ694_27590 [Streptomyces albidoflavus]|uniref:hypothetical protein n=1 Tax=Streptomyces albidoflavus TaxID=1886 RepID=UPI0033FAD7B4